MKHNTQVARQFIASQIEAFSKSPLLAKRIDLRVDGRVTSAMMAEAFRKADFLVEVRGGWCLIVGKKIEAVPA